MNTNQDEKQQYNTVEPRFIEGQRKLQNLFALTRFRHDRGSFSYILLLLG